MKKVKTILLIGLTIILFGIFYWNSLKAKPEKFIKENTIKHIYFHFKKGGDIDYTSEFENSFLKISNQKEVNFLINEISKLSLDWNAEHRPSDFSVYINFSEYKMNKWELKMGKINYEYVFFMGSGLYKNDSLADYVIKRMGIRKLK